MKTEVEAQVHQDFLPLVPINNISALNKQKYESNLCNML